MRYGVYLAILLAVAFAYRSYSSRPAEVTVALATVAPLKASFTAEGSVKAKEYDLSPEVSGRIVAIYVREGDLVKKGRPLIDLDSSEISAATVEAQASERAANAAVRQAEAQRDLSREQSNARIRSAKALLAQARARLRQVLAGVRPQEIAQAEHQIQKLQSEATDAERSYQRAKFLFENKAVSRADMEAAENRLNIAEAAVAQAKDALALLQAGARTEEREVAQSSVDAAAADLSAALSGQREVMALEQAVGAARARAAEAAAAIRRIQTGLSKIALKAPADGFITHVRVEVGALASPSSPAITMASRSDLRVEAEISSEDAAKVRPGMPVVVTSPAYPGTLFKAKIVSLSAVGELKPDAAIRTRIVRARVAVEHPERFRPGMEVDVEGESVLKTTLTVPSDALTFSGSTVSVFILEKGGVHQQVVTTGFSNADRTEILSGLKAGASVVVRGKENLKDGQAVRVKP